MLDDPGMNYRFVVDVPLRWVDVDSGGVVNNAVYLSYFEAARGGYYTEVVGHPFGTGPDADKRTFVIAEARITYRLPAFYGEPLYCATRVGWVSRSAFSFEYRLEVKASDLGAARVVADGSTVQVFYDLERGRHDAGADGRGAAHGPQRAWRFDPAGRAECECGIACVATRIRDGSGWHGHGRSE